MRWIDRLTVRLRSLLRRNHVERELETELRFHLDQQMAESLAAGMNVEDARASALRSVGSLTLVKEQCRDSLGLRLLDEVRHDARYALRQLRQNPGFTTVAVLTLALGIGANTAVFSVVKAVLLKPLPYSDPDRIVTISTAIDSPTLASIGRQITDADFLDWHSQATDFEAMAYYASREGAVQIGERAEYARLSRVSSEFFDVFAVRPSVGRFFDANEVKPGAGNAAIVSHAFAQSHFGGSEQAIGQTLHFFNRVVPIVGVLPAGFGYPASTQIWTPMVAGNPPNRRGQNFRAIGRLKRDVSLEGAQSEMSTIAGRLAQQYPDTNSGRHLVIMRLQDELVGDVRLMLYVLLAAVGLVLTLACTNLATLLLVRATARAQEITVRAALGASRGRIARQLLVEGFVLGLVSGTVGLLLAFGGLRAFISEIPANVPRLSEIEIDAPVLLFTLGISVLSSVLLGLAPAFQTSQVHIESGLKQSAARSVVGNRAPRRIREGLVIAQIAMAVVLLVGGGLLIRSFLALQNVALGFQPQNVLVTNATVATPDPRQGASLFFRDLIATISNVPGVVAAGATMAAPGRVDSSGGIWVDHVPEPSEMSSGPLAVLSIVAPGTFATLGIPLVSGRDFDDRDVPEGPMTAIVNQALARRAALPGQDIVGHQIVCSFDTQEPMTIVGVVGDVHQAGPAQDPQPECYMPYLQHFYNGARLSVVVRTANDPIALAETVRRKAHELAPAVPVKFTTLETLTAENVAEPRFRAVLLGVFASVALVLAVIGVFGVMAYVVSQRTREVGMRLALGATHGHILRLFLGRGLALTLAGLTIGLLAAAITSQFLASLLFATKSTDQLTYLLVSILLGSTALLALYLPARRATKVDPIVALHCD